MHDRPSHNPRRVFLLQLAAGSAGLTASSALPAQTKVDEADDGAVALGYKHDGAQVDTQQYTQFKPEQQCNNCQFYQGKPIDTWAGCSMFGREQITAAGWCLAYKKVG